MVVRLDQELEGDVDEDQAGGGRTGLYGVDGRIRERTHSSRDETDDHVLIRRQFRQFRLILMRELLDLLVRSKVRTYHHTAHPSASSLRTW